MSKLGRDTCMDRLMILSQNSHILQSTFKYSSYYYMYMLTTLYNHICYCMIICAAISQNNAIDKFTVLRTCAMLRNDSSRLHQTCEAYGKLSHEENPSQKDIWARRVLSETSTAQNLLEAQKGFLHYVTLPEMGITNKLYFM